MVEEKDDGTVLPFSGTKQNALLGHMMINEKFFKIVHQKIKPTWFLSEKNSQAYKLLLNFYEKYKIFPKSQELLNSPELLSMDIKERNSLISYIGRNIMETQQVRLETIKPELTEWLHTVILMKSMSTAEKFFNGKDIKRCHSELMAAVKEVSTTTFENGDVITFADFDDYLKESKIDRENALTTGLGVLDRALLSGAKNGGLQYRDTTIVMAPVNSGKCLGKDTPVIMADGTRRMVQDIKNGEQVMGPDGKPRNVTGVTIGRSRMFKIVPRDGGMEWVCNDIHILSLRAYYNSEIINVPLDRYIATSPSFKENYKMWRAKPDGKIELYSFDIKEIRHGRYFGFELDGDHLFLLGDFTVTHNTRFLITVSCHNILQGKTVLFMTHEGDPKQLRIQFLSNILGLPVEDVVKLRESEHGRLKLTPAVAMLDKHLKYIPYNKAGAMYIERVVPIIRAAQEEWMGNHNGKGFDLLVSDYPALLQTETASKGMLPKREIDRIVYDNYVQLALEYGFHALLAIQTNREGSKINKGLANQNRVLEMEDVKESWDPMAEASNVLTLNRSPDAERKGILLINIAKSRTNAKGTVIVANSNFGCNTTHSEQLGGMAYSGSAMPDEIVNDIWETWKGQATPAKALAKPAPQ